MWNLVTCSKNNVTQKNSALQTLKKSFHSVCTSKVDRPQSQAEVNVLERENTLTRNIATLTLWILFKPPYVKLNRPVIHDVYSLNKVLFTAVTCSRNLLVVKCINTLARFTKEKKTWVEKPTLTAWTSSQTCWKYNCLLNVSIVTELMKHYLTETWPWTHCNTRARHKNLVTP